MAETKRDTSKLSDDQLTEAELKIRVKNREKRQRQKNKQKGSTDVKQTEAKKPQSKKPAKPANNNQGKKPELSFDERNEIKTKRQVNQLEDDPQNNLVVRIETTASRDLAYQVNEINTIDKYVRQNIGTDRLDMIKGGQLINMFNESVMGSLDVFIEMAHAAGIGSRYGLKDFKEAAKAAAKEAGRLKANIAKSIENDNTAEKKAREAEAKKLTTASDNYEKALKALEEAQTAMTDAQAEVDAGFKERISAQRDRADKSDKKENADTKKVA